jgi:hypothetical protein
MAVNKLIKRIFMASTDKILTYSVACRHEANMIDAGLTLCSAEVLTGAPEQLRRLNLGRWPL